MCVKLYLFVFIYFYYCTTNPRRKCGEIHLGPLYILQSRIIMRFPYSSLSTLFFKICYTPFYALVFKIRSLNPWSFFSQTAPDDTVELQRSALRYCVFPLHV